MMLQNSCWLPADTGTLLHMQPLITAVAQKSRYKTCSSAASRYRVCIFFGVVLVCLDDRNQPGVIFSILHAFYQHSRWRTTQMCPLPSIGKIAERRCFLVIPLQLLLLERNFWDFVIRINIFEGSCLNVWLWNEFSRLQLLLAPPLENSAVQ